MKPFIRVMKAMSDPNRVKILKLLQVRELCVCEITSLLAVSQPTVSKHLKILEDAGLIASRREGTWIIYRIEPDPANPVAMSMVSQLEQWLGDDPEIKRLTKQLPLAAKLRQSAA